jgi:hypothetical protein
MYDAMRTVGSWACLYFIAIVVIGNYVVLNLFLAILLDNFSGLDTGGGDGDQDARHAALVELKQAEKQQEEKERRREARKKTEKLRELEKDAANVGGDERRAKAATRRLRLSAMRKSLESFVTHRWFEKSMLFMIVLSSCLLAVDSPVEVDKDSRLKYWLDVSDVFFVGLFVLEAALKIVALGKRYFKNGWNVLDFCIVSLGVASAAITALASSSDENAAVAAKILRAFRALRPLRIASRSAGMKVVMSALFSAIPAISNVALVCILFYLIFGILGLNLFMGRMHRCVDLYTNEPVDPNSWGLSKGELTKTVVQIRTEINYVRGRPTRRGVTRRRRFRSKRSKRFRVAVRVESRAEFRRHGLDIQLVRRGVDLHRVGRDARRAGRDERNRRRVDLRVGGGCGERRDRGGGRDGGDDGRA